MLEARIAAVLFDLDGTLLDTDDQAVDRLARRLRPFLGRRAHSFSRGVIMKAETPGNALITLLDVLGLDRQLIAVGRRVRRQHAAAPEKTFQLVPGVQEMLLRLHETGYRLAIVTTRTRSHISQFLAQFPHLAPLFEATCGLQDTRRLKPHPAPILLAASRLDVTVEECLMVGDTTADVRSAKRAGAWSAAVLCGFGERAELASAGADIILENTADLADFLKMRR